MGFLNLINVFSGFYIIVALVSLDLQMPLYVVMVKLRILLTKYMRMVFFVVFFCFFCRTLKNQNIFPYCFTCN